MTDIEMPLVHPVGTLMPLSGQMTIAAEVRGRIAFTHIELQNRGSSSSSSSFICS